MQYIAEYRHIYVAGNTLPMSNGLNKYYIDNNQLMNNNFHSFYGTYVG